MEIEQVFPENSPSPPADGTVSSGTETEEQITPPSPSTEKPLLPSGKKLAGLGKAIKRRKRKKGAHINFRPYIYRVLQQIHPTMSISSQCMTIVNDAMNDILRKLCRESANTLEFIGKTQTLGANSIRTSCKLLIPRELCIHAESEANKAMARYKWKRV